MKKGRRLTKEEEKLIVEMYQNKDEFELEDIAKKMGLGHNTIPKILKRLGIEPNRNPRVPQSKINTLIEKYNGGVSAEKIAEELDIDPTNSIRIMRKNGVKIRSLSECHRTYKVVEDYFDNIDSEAKAYFLGLLYADGNLSSEEGRNCIKITLQKKDDDIRELPSPKGEGFLDRHVRSNILWMIQNSLSQAKNISSCILISIIYRSTCTCYGPI